MYADFRRYLPDPEKWAVDMDIAESDTVRDVCRRLHIPDGEPKMILCNGLAVDETAELHERDVLSIFSLIGGG